MLNAAQTFHQAVEAFFTAYTSPALLVVGVAAGLFAALHFLAGCFNREPDAVLPGLMLMGVMGCAFYLAGA